MMIYLQKRKAIDFNVTRREKKDKRKYINHLFKECREKEKEKHIYKNAFQILPSS